jgi:hypothetical protein
MIFDTVRELTSSRYVEVRRLLAHIKAVEQAKPNDAVAREDATFLRGLFFVHLYAAFEYSVSTAVTVLLEGISDLQVTYADLESLFYALALDPRFEAAAASGPDRRWQTRRELLLQQVSSDPCHLESSMLAGHLQNLWARTLEVIFECLCIDGPIVPEIRIRGYVDEVVNHRNAVSHGRSSASVVGRIVTSTELERVLEAILQITYHVIDRFEAYFTSRQFIASPHRERYAASS